MPAKHIWSRVLFGAGVVGFVLIMIFHPQVIFEGSVNGLKAWWNIVFPSLLPFFIASELLMSLGVVHFMGVLLEPVMRPLFNVPGTGSFVMAIGFTSGYPIGSMVTARLRSQGLCTRIEAERLMSFTNNSSPLFMLVAVAVGMFNNPATGIVVAGAHYLANITLGLALRFYRRQDCEMIARDRTSWRGIPARAFREMTGVLQREKRPFGKIMGDAIKNSVNNLLNIGGFIILFAVIIRLLAELGMISLLAAVLGKILVPLGVSTGVLNAIASGIFEMTMGTKLASEARAPLLQQLIAVAIILAWSGLSVIAQVSSMISHTDIRIGPFIVARIFHALLAAAFTVVLYRWFRPDLNTAAVFSTCTGHDWSSTLSMVINSLEVFLVLLILLILLGFLVNAARRTFHFLSRTM